jgi:membrane protein
MAESRLISTLRKFLKELFLTWGTARSPQAAAALAYYGMFSFAPIIFIAVSVAGVFFDRFIAANEVLVRLEATLGPEVTQFILDVVVKVSQGASGGTPLTTLIGFIALLFAASGLFAQLQYALNNIWEVPPPTQRGILAIVISRLLAFVMVIGLGLLLVLMTASSIILSTLSMYLNLDHPLPTVELALFLGLGTAAFALIYRVLPDVDIAWRDVWLGALVTALLFALARWLLGFFLAHASLGSAFDAAGGLAVILVVIYYLALMFLFGAVFTKVYASMFGSKAGSTPE